MKLKLCRRGNIFNSKFYVIFILLLAVSVVMIMIRPFRYDLVFAAITVLSIYLIVFPLNFPKYIELDDCQIKYVTPITFPMPRGSGFKCVKTHYTVTNITQIELQQNAIEKVLGIAHLTFSGTNKIYAKKHISHLPDIKTHCIYGIVLKKHQSTIESFILNCKDNVGPSDNKN